LKPLLHAPQAAEPVEQLSLFASIHAFFAMGPHLSTQDPPLFLKSPLHAPQAAEPVEQLSLLAALHACCAAVSHLSSKATEAASFWPLAQ